MNHTKSQSKAFQRTASLELSKWYMGIVLTNLVEKKDNNAAFSLLEATLVPGNEPPPIDRRGKEEPVSSLAANTKWDTGKRLIAI